MHTVAKFEITRTRYLDPSGKPCVALPEFARDADALIAMYRAMVLTRVFDNKAVALQRTGRLGTFASSLGQEAVSVAVGRCMSEEDVLLPAYRDAGAQIQRGVTLVELLQYWGGDERGMNFAAQPVDFPICIPIATQTTHAVGVATAFKLRRQPRVAVTVAGDGATSKGDFYEAMNLAGVWTLPVVFIINNNQWAISVSRKFQSATETLAQKAIAAGIPGEQVDGNDIVALCDAVTRALARARGGEGATLIEALTYRLADHTTADDASRYRDPAEVKAQWQSEPVARLRAYLHAEHLWSADSEQVLQQECAAEVDSAVERYLSLPAPAPRAMFDHLYASLPKALNEQRQAVASRGDHG